jgi:hypothetical protein
VDRAAPGGRSGHAPSSGGSGRRTRP